ncbi:MAG TPA: phospholipase C, phosphocholine-specific [Rhizomicrobium sp.]|jgi:phospholipase C|nr:phospholipase C, phosphocholine-specific [Rhizomicrobium sp.]
MQNDRRTFLKLGAATLAVLPLSLQRALALPARPRSGTIADVEHVVILMQENRSFDHYFGSLRGVRGFGDPRAIALPGGGKVWQQPRTPGDSETVSPFHLDTRTTFAQGMHSLDHSWKKSHALWKHHDAWIAVKGEMTMGYFTRADLPFYYALADAFTICDAYHCSIFGPTTPNRLFLFSGTSGLSVGDNGNQVIANPDAENNYTGDRSRDTKGFAGFAWTSYAERLQKAGIDWRVYQEFDNYGDNALAYMANFRSPKVTPDLAARGRSIVAGSDEQNAKASRGEHLVAAFAADVKADRLPQVSWIVAPYIMCEHPTATPGYGESLTARLLEALAANPEVWAKTAFILNYDENDGFFDHVPPLVPAIHESIGLSSTDTRAENYLWEPVGFGPRVPLIVVSPWTRGGFVNSQLCDHTSVLRFLEKRFGVAEPNISPWRRAVSGDLTSMFDFTQGRDWPALHDGADGIARADGQSRKPLPKLPKQTAAALQEPGRRPARPLPYRFDATIAAAANGQTLTFTNDGAAGAGFIVYSARAGEGPWFYMVEAGKTLSQTLAVAAPHDLRVHGSNGFFRRFAGDGLTAAARHDAAAQQLVVSLRNDSHAAATFTVEDAYSGRSVSYTLAAGTGAEHRQGLAQSDHWYDLTLRKTGDAGLVRQLAGHVETGAVSWSDPLIGRG